MKKGHKNPVSNTKKYRDDNCDFFENAALDCGVFEVIFVNDQFSLFGGKWVNQK